MKEIRRVHLEIRGTVQGVGFRPFLSRLAGRHQVSGWVRNTSFGVEAGLEGTADELELFLREMKKDAPPLAKIEEVRQKPLAEISGGNGFRILPSLDLDGATFLPPDTAPCPECRRELFDPADRRYRYPFLNCTNCGPRYTIAAELPYDRRNTVMRSFPMCFRCREEYENIENRRYHAQPDCCGDCGPRAFYLDEQGNEKEGDAFEAAQKALAAGKILAVKGTGGIHLACDAENEEAVKRLRERKNRPFRPLAVMCRSQEEAERICRLSDPEKKLLSGPARPIVLAEKRDRGAWRELSFSGRLGVMLPYTPFHELLMDGTFGGPALAVMTSANLPGCPVLTENKEALEALAGIADGFLLHDRPVQNRCDDSLVMEWKGREYFLRRSRGYVPAAVKLEEDVTGILALGAEQKASFAEGRGRDVFLSPHIGDLKNLETLEHYRKARGAYERLFQLRPEFLACDLHPDFISTKEAKEIGKRLGLPVLPVQHHWAHMASCMADNGLKGPAFGIVWDGTGLGMDGTVWGAEFLRGDFRRVSRAGSIRPIKLPGGDRAVKEIGRIGLSLLWDAGCRKEEVPLAEPARQGVLALLDAGISCPGASSMGRLFDGIFSLLCCQGTVSYEGEGALRLEALSSQERLSADPAEIYPLVFTEEDGLRRFDIRPLVRGVVRDKKAGVPAGRIACRFMETLCRMALEQCRALNRERLPVVLSGGVFQNRFLLSGVTELLEKDGFSVYCHRQVSPGDEGICLGQLAIAAEKRRRTHVSGTADESEKSKISGGLL